jgi:hypothetical protein
MVQNLMEELVSEKSKIRELELRWSQKVCLLLYSQS